MVPASFISLAEMPLTPSGKVNRLALPVPGAESSQGDNNGDNNGDNSSDAPSDLLELQLKRIWEQLFEREVSLRDHFFDDLGGHSLLAARLFAQIKGQLGHHLPLATLFEAPTIEGLAARLRQSGWSPPWSSLVTVQPGAGRPPIFWVPAAGVTALSFVDLARHLGPDQPFYSLQPLGLDTDVAPHTSVAEMAKHYLQEIRALYPQGPYRLGGRCFGATVAFEMAQQLHVSGERVELLVMQDGGPPIPLQRSPTEWLRRAHQHWQHGVLADILWRHFHRRERMVRERIKRHAINVFGTPEARRLQGVLDAHLVAANSYHGSPYPGRIVLLWSSEFDVRMANLWQSGWEQLALGGVESYVVSGKHRTMLQEPDVIHLATQLRTLLDETASMEAVGDCTV